MNASFLRGLIVGCVLCLLVVVFVEARTERGDTALYEAAPELYEACKLLHAALDAKIMPGLIGSDDEHVAVRMGAWAIAKAERKP